MGFSSDPIPFGLKHYSSDHAVYIAMNFCDNRYTVLNKYIHLAWRTAFFKLSSSYLTLSGKRNSKVLPNPTILK